MKNASSSTNIQLVALIFCVPAGILMGIVGLVAPSALPVLMLALVLIWLCAAIGFQRTFDWAVDNLAQVVDNFATENVSATVLRAILLVTRIPTFPLSQRYLRGVETLPTHCLTARLLPAPIQPLRVA